MRPSVHALPFMMALLAVAIPAVYMLPGGSDAAGTVTVSVALDAHEPVVDVCPGSDGIITFTGTVSITQTVDTQFQTAVVNLVVDTGQFQSTEISPIIIFAQSRDVPFSFSIQVPPGTMSTKVDKILELSIGGTWVYEPGTLTGQVTPTMFFLEIAPFYLYSITSSHQYVQTSPGGEFDLDLRIKNEGNNNDRVQIDLLNREALDKAGWSVQYEINAFDIPYDEEKVVQLHVTTPVKWKGYKNTVTPIRFAVSSTYAVVGEEMSEIVSYTVYVRERGVSVPGFEAPLIVLAALVAAFVQISRRRVMRE